MALIDGASKRHAHLTQEDLRRQIKEGFSTSAYRGVDGRVEPPPREDDSLHSKDNLRFAAMISNSLDPFPMPKVGCVPKGLTKATYTHNSTMNHKTHTFRQGEEMAHSLPAFSGERHTAGRVPNGLHNSRGFMETMSTQRAEAENAHFDDTVMKAYEEGKRREMAAEAARLALQAKPFESAEPPMYVKSTQEHCNMIGIGGRRDPALTIHNSASRQRSSPTAAGSSAQQQEAALLETLHRMREESKPRKYGRTASASSWCSTAREAFDAYDAAAAEQMNGRYATQPVSHRNQQLSEEDLKRVQEIDARAAHRFDGYETETSAKLRDRHTEAEVTRGYGMQGLFDVRNGVMLTSKKVHHPRDVKTGETYSPSQIVQGQFVATTAEPLPHRNP